MAGCGSKKMAKGGMVKKAKGGMKISPRKAMAMGKKPSGSKNGVQKFAFGGMVSPGRAAVMKKMAPPRPFQATMGNPNQASMGDSALRSEMLDNLVAKARTQPQGPTMNQAPKGPTLNPIQALNKLAIRRAKGGMVKKGCK